MQEVIDVLESQNRKLEDTAFIKWLSTSSTQRSFEIFEDKIAFLPALIPFFMGVRDIVDSLEVEKSDYTILNNFKQDFKLDEEIFFEEFTSLGFHPSRKDREFSYNFGKYWKNKNKAQRLFNLKTYSFSMNSKEQALITLTIIQDIYLILENALKHEINTDELLSIHWPQKIIKKNMFKHIILPAQKEVEISYLIDEIYGLAYQCFESWFQSRSEFKRNLLLTRKLPHSSELNSLNHIQ